MGATYLDESGKPRLMEMGCYGIGVTRLLGAAIEQNHDERGIIWPVSMAPFEVVVCPIGYDRSDEVRSAADRVYAELKALGVDVLLDDRGEPLQGLDTASKAWNHQWRNRGSQPGFDVHRTAQFLISKSTDDGKTWGEPVNITTAKDSAWWLYAPAPGHGITLRDGTLVFPTQGRNAVGVPFSNITYSRDGGRSWTVSRPAAVNTTECMAVQLSDGGIMLNMRHNDNRKDTGSANGRAVAVTYDLGKTWTEHPTSRKALIEPTCMASIHKHAYAAGGKQKHILLFSNPNAMTGRFNMTIKGSFDDGLSWPKENWLLLDEGKSRGYSCITSINDRTIGILYEGSRADMVFQMIPVSVLTGN
jgi:sialidase-1